MDGKKLQGFGGDLIIPPELFGSKDAEGQLVAVDIKITDRGEVFANHRDIGTILIVRPDDNNTLQRISNQDFVGTWTANITPVNPEEVTIKQGWIEGSNVDIISEMVQMIELQRMFEAGSKVISTNDSTLDKSIQLGRYQ